tara:strand:- start:8797 stop:9477 length:681 start_codon:yes stop_codon:yes gene_type:complete
MVNVAYAKDKIQVVTESWYPYNYLDKNGNVVGKSTDKVKEVLSATGVDYSIKVYPWTRAFKLATTRANVLIYSILRTPKREKLFYWFCPISSLEPHKIYKLTNRMDIVVNSQQDIKKYTISVTRDTFLHQYMLNLGFVDGVNLQINSSDAIATKMFFAGRVDLLADLASSMEHTLTTQELDNSIVTALSIIPAQHYAPICMALSKQTPIALVNKVRQAHEKFIAKQ